MRSLDIPKIIDPVVNIPERKCKGEKYAAPSVNAQALP
jgi:hypothetical protein